MKTEKYEYELLLDVPRDLLEQIDLLVAAGFHGSTREEVLRTILHAGAARRIAEIRQTREDTAAIKALLKQKGRRRV